MNLRRYHQVRAPLTLPLGYALVFPLIGTEKRATIGYITQVLFHVIEAGHGDVSESGFIRQVLPRLQTEAVGEVPTSGYARQTLLRILQDAEAHVLNHIDGVAREQLYGITQHLQGETNHAEIAMVLRRIQQSAIGGMQSDGAIAQRLAALRQLAFGSVPITGDIEEILHGIEQHAFASVPPAGVIDQTLSAIIQHLTAKTVNAEGEIAQLLDGIATAINAEVALIYRAHASMIVGRPILIEISGSVGPTGHISQRLGRFSQEVDGMFHPTGSISQRLFPIISTAVGSRSASIDMQLHPVRQQIIAGMESFGAMAFRLNSQFRQAVEGHVSAKGYVAQTLPGARMSGSFLVSQYYGYIAQTLARVQSNIGGSANLTARASQILLRPYMWSYGNESFNAHAAQYLRLIEQNVQVAVSASWGTIAQTLQRTTQAAEGYMPPAGYGVQTLQRLRSASDGWAQIVGNATPVLPRPVQRGVMYESMDGSIVQELYPQRVIIGGQGSALNYGHIDQALFAARPTAIGWTEIVGSASQRLSRVIQDGGGLAPTYGLMNQELGKVTQAASAHAAPTVRCAAAQTLGGISQAASGWRNIEGAAAQILPPFSMSMFGENGGGVSVLDEEKMIPNGRLTLVSGEAWMGAAVTGATTVYYAPAIGNVMYYWSGAIWIADTFAEISQTLADTTSSPAATQALKSYDMFVWKDGGGDYRLSRGPAWTSYTNRGTGAGTSELLMQRGFHTNRYDITNGPAAGYGLYVGTIRTNYLNQLNWNVAMDYASAAQSVPVFNAFNQRQIAMSTYDTYAPDGDPYWSDVVLLLTANPDGTITDKSSRGHTFVKKGTVGTTTNHSQFGNYVIDLSAAGDHGLWDGNSSADYVMFRTDAVWTIDFWVYHTAMSSSNDYLCNRIGGGSGSWLYEYGQYIGMGSRPGSDITYATSGGVMNGRWQHIAFQYYNGQTQVFLNGYQVYNGLIVSADSAAMTLGIGMFVNDSGGNPYGGLSTTGYFDQIRITRNQLRYKGFGPPTAPYPTHGL